jgi:CheY-like chemotaxis protein
VSAVGGAIEVDSTVGKGSIFRVRFPAAQGALSTRPPASSPAINPERRGRVLVVDDEALVARGHARLLASSHDVEIATSSTDALARLIAGQSYDVVLCDLMMPGMDGMELEARIADAVPEMVGRLVFVTGGALSVEARTFLEAGRTYLDKPVDPATLRALIAERLSN